MIMRLAPGDWSLELGPFMEAQVQLLPHGALLILPVLAETGSLYAWTHQTQATAFRAAYLSQAGFIGRTVVWYSILLGLAALLLLRPGRSVPVACIGLVLVTVFGTCIATDWL